VIVAGITHAPFDARRRAWLSQLVPCLKPWPVIVQPDPGRTGSYANHRRTLLRLNMTPATHVCCLDDDVKPVPGFTEAVERMVRLLPERAICLYVPQPNARRLVAEGKRWTVSAGNLYGAAFVMPRAWIGPWLEWIDQYVADDFWSFDIRLKFWLRTMQQPIWTPLPGLVTHLGSQHSLLGHKPGFELPEADVSDFDARGVDWSDGHIHPVKSGSEVNWMYWWKRARKDPQADPPWRH